MSRVSAAIGVLSSAFVVLLVGASAGAAPHLAHRPSAGSHSRHATRLLGPRLSVKVLTTDQVSILQAGGFAVRISARHTASVRLLAVTPSQGHLVAIAAPQTYRIRARTRASHVLKLAVNELGRKALSTCYATDITLIVRGRSYGSPGLRTRRRLKVREQRFRFICRHGALTPVALSSPLGLGPQTSNAPASGSGGSGSGSSGTGSSGSGSSGSSGSGSLPEAGGQTGSVAPRSYYVGTDAEPINPCPDGTWSPAADPTKPPQCPGASKYVFLGGFGFGGGPVGQCPACTSNPATGRPANGVLRSIDPTLTNADGAHTRAFAATDGKTPLLLADMEVQGWFVADKNNKTGIIDMRNRVARDLAGVSAQQVFIQSDHSHSGADALGVWGGVPESFLEYMANQTVTAIERAYVNRQPGRLFYGSTDGKALLTNQFSSDPANQTQDSAVRVLQARDNSGKPFATLVNFSAHADVLGGDNSSLSGDWLQALNPILEKKYGGQAVTLVGTVGRTQPQRDPATTACPGQGSVPAIAFCRIEHYGQEVADRADQALKGATPIDGNPTVDAHSYLIQDPATNATILGFDYVPGGVAGLPFIRSTDPPWATANVLGTVSATARIGDVLLSSVPGEIYPQIALKVQQTVTGIRPGGFMTAGLSNDQLGYIIAPLEAYPQPAERSLFSDALTSDVIQGCVQSPNPPGFKNCPQPSPISNDNYFFNVSHTLGERLTCSLLRGADDILHPGKATFRDSYNRCVLFPNDAQMPAGSDIALGGQIPQGPGVPTGGQNGP